LDTKGSDINQGINGSICQKLFDKIFNKIILWQLLISDSLRLRGVDSMLLKYWEKQRLTQAHWPQELAAMELSPALLSAVMEPVLREQGEALLSVYWFSRYSEEPGSLVVCHDIGRGVISFGAYSQWGRWDETAEILTLDASGEQFNFEGQPLSEGDDGSCSLGNI
jgi:hypothetical protein